MARRKYTKARTIGKRFSKRLGVTRLIPVRKRLRVR